MACFLLARGALVALAVALAGCGVARGASAPASTGSPPARAAAGVPAPLLVAAGDIACHPGQPRTVASCHQAATAALAGRLHPTAVAVLGDTQYDRGQLTEYLGSFAHSWGHLKARIHPATGNHEYATPGAAGYYSYFGAAAGPRGRGYYSYELGAWHVVVLNSNCSVVSCAATSAQVRWLRADLAAHPRRCTLAYWHHPRFSSGFHGNDTSVAPLWSALYAGGADVVLDGHDHDYERFAPQSPAGRRDLVRGIREFIVGTGGEDQRPFLLPKANSERRSSGTFGVLALTLRPTGYSWRFVPEPGRTFRDAGAGACH